MGIFKPESKKYVLDQIEELRQRGAEGIVLGCTEFPLIIKPADVTMPVFDTTLLHSQMAVDFILGKQGLAHVTELLAVTGPFALQFRHQAQELRPLAQGMEVRVITEDRVVRQTGTARLAQQCNRPSRVPKQRINCSRCVE